PPHCTLHGTAIRGQRRLSYKGRVMRTREGQMTDAVTTGELLNADNHHHPLHAARSPRWTQRATSFGVFGIIAVGTIYVTTAIVGDLSHMPDTTALLPFVLLAVALSIALGFEFVNGFHDTANAVATVIYTHSMPAQVAVVWSGIWNL